MLQGRKSLAAQLAGAFAAATLARLHHLSPGTRVLTRTQRFMPDQQARPAGGGRGGPPCCRDPGLHVFHGPLRRTRGRCLPVQCE